MIYDVKLLDAIKDRIVVVGCDPVEVEEGCVVRDALWQFLLDGHPVSLFCSFPSGEPSQENERAKEFLARDLYIKDPENRSTIKAEICHEYVFHGWTTIDVSVPKCASDKEKLDLANKAALDADKPLEYPDEDYDLASIDWSVQTIDGQDVRIQDSPCVWCFIRNIAERDILLQENDSADVCLKMNELIIEARSLLQNM